jgi:hypothetical protein
MKEPTTRRPVSPRRFTWARIPGDGWVCYRLFRRSIARRVHLRADTFTAGMPRAEIARRLRAMRRQLLDEVDAIDLEHLGVTEEAPA